MSIEGDLHSALMAKVETVTGYTVLWPQKGGDKPAGEFLSVFHLPNDNGREFLGSGDPLDRRGFIVLRLVSPLGEYEVVSKRKAGEIAETFALDTVLTFNGTSISVHNSTVKQGQEIDNRWETPIWIEYRGHA